MDDFIIKDFDITDLWVNPENARFINPEEIFDEISAINEIIKLNANHVINLSKDIAENGLNPNELPIVMQDPEYDKILIMDGNRRISCIKLMTQYRNELDKFDLTSAQKREILSLNCNIQSIKCVLCNDEEEVNYLLEKLHTSKPGISQVKWDPQAQDRHKLKTGTISKRLAIVKMLNCSKHTLSEAREILNEKGWLSKLKRFTSDKYISFFGIKFDSDNNILLFIEESEVMKGLSKLIIDLKNIKADEIAQTERARLNYLENFDNNFKPDLSKTINPLVMFNTSTEEFITTDIINKFFKSTVDDISLKTKEVNNSEDKKNSNNTESKKNISNDIKESDNNKAESKYNPATNNNETPNTNTINPTLTRNSLIPQEENIPIKNQRVADLYSELKLINIYRYTNTVSIAFRSLIEFSINCYLEKYYPKWAFHEKVTLIEKLEKVLRILESTKDKNYLKNQIPAIYRWIDIYNQDSNKDNLVSIKGLNIIVHNHLYHPDPTELKNIYNNYSPFLKLIWKQI